VGTGVVAGVGVGGDKTDKWRMSDFFKERGNKRLQKFFLEFTYLRPMT
jgi:hypothetical protein